MSRNLVSFAAVKRAVSIEAVLTHYGLFGNLALKGDNLTGPCPFCTGSSGRHFRVSLQKNAWYCFGCKAGGNILDLVSKRDGVSLRESALRLNEWFDLGLAGAKEDAEPSREKVRRDPVAPSVLPERNEPLSFALKTIDPAHPTLEALGLSEAIIEEYGLGHCSRGLLRDRIAIPIHNVNGELLAYAGLAAERDLPERYLFPPKFFAALEVFNMHRLLQAPPDSETVYLAPEILGVLRLAGAGIPSLLGLFDGSLSEPQEEALKTALPEGARLVLVGKGFEPSVFERLSRTFSLRNLTTSETLLAVQSSEVA